MRYGAVYSGAGGMALGAHIAGLHVAWGIDNDPDCVATFNRNFGNAVYADIAGIRWQSLPEVDVLGFGLPFQKIHSEYERNSTSLADKFDIYQSVIDAVDALKPRYFLVAIDHGLTHFFRRGMYVTRWGNLMNRLTRRLPYDFDRKIILFHEMGVPQIRTQVFIAGWHKGELPYEFPWNLYPITLPCRVALGSIPKDAANHEFLDQPDDVVKVRRVRGRMELTGERQVFVERESSMDDGERRLDPDRPGFMIMPGWSFDDVYKHPWEDRRLTAREQARLQTFPDWFVFEGGHDSVRCQIGQAVPPDGARPLLDPIVDILRVF